MKVHYIIIIFLFFASCHTHNTVPKEVSDYLTETIDLLKKRSVNRNIIDWNEFRIDVFRKARKAKSIKDTYSAVKYAVTELKDKHSYFKPVTEAEEKSEMKPLPKLTDEITPNDIGYIRIPFCIGSESENSNYISRIRKKISEQSKKELKGWIVDLRGNFGGNMWPMLLSVEPLLGNGTVGYFAYPGNTFEDWKLAEGKVYLNEQLISKTDILSNDDLSKQFVAVLIDSQTASSGEALVVAFKCRENSRLFGQPTFGVSSGCLSHTLSDGSVINLAENVFADRKGRKYGAKLNPDYVTRENEELNAGIEWIYKMRDTY